MSFASQALGRIRREGWSLMPYVLGPFHTVRALYSAQARALHRPASSRSRSGTTLFPATDVGHAVASLRRDAVHRPVSLPAPVVAELTAIAQTAPLTARSARTKYTFRYDDVQNARLPAGELVLMGQVLDAGRFAAVRRVAEDPTALQVMSQYLGYSPRKREIRMFWSFVSDTPLEERIKAGQTTQFHFDVQSYNFAYACYYLVDTDRSNGAHVMVSGSHKSKPAPWLFGSANQTDEAIYAHYPAKDILTIEGKAGSGFWQDSSCYHKALALEKGERLVLQVRYF